MEGNLHHHQSITTTITFFNHKSASNAITLLLVGADKWLLPYGFPMFSCGRVAEIITFLGFSHVFPMVFICFPHQNHGFNPSGWRPSPYSRWISHLFGRVGGGGLHRRPSCVVTGRVSLVLPWRSAWVDWWVVANELWWMLDNVASDSIQCGEQKIIWWIIAVVSNGV